MNIADRIQLLRKAKGISQEVLADQIGVSRQAVSKWESEQSMPDLEKIILLSDYFETTTDQIGRLQRHHARLAIGQLVVAVLHLSAFRKKGKHTPLCHLHGHYRPNAECPLV